MQKNNNSQQSSINSEEIKKFSNMATDWWNTEGKFKILHRFNDARILFIDAILKANNLIPNATEVLDVGCGGGLLSESMAKKHYKVTGIDAESETINQAKKHAEANGLNITYINTSPEEYLSENNKQFDVIFAMEIIEHVNSPETFVATLNSLLKPGGLIFFSTINKNIKSIILAKYVAEYVLNWLPRGTHNPNKFISPSSLIAMLREHKIFIEDIKGINFNVLKQNWNLNPSPSINYICAFKKEA